MVVDPPGKNTDEKKLLKPKVVRLLGYCIPLARDVFYIRSLYDASLVV